MEPRQGDKKAPRKQIKRYTPPKEGHTANRAKKPKITVLLRHAEKGKKTEKNTKKAKNLLFFTYRPKGPEEREQMTKLVLNMVFLFGVLLVAWQLQDNGQHAAGALLLLVSLALAFVVQIEKGTK